MSSDLNERLRILEAKDAIREKLYSYCRSVDRLDAELGYTVFAEDSFADYGDTFDGPGREAIDLILMQHEFTKYTSHQISNVIIKVNGNKAVSEAYCTACIEKDDEDGHGSYTARVRYNDTWECRDDNWMIVNRIVSGDISFFGGIESGLEQFNTSRGDKSDPSYGCIG